jgi:hypothetical protein
VRVAIVAVVALFVACSAGRPDQPTAIAWDREVCAHCHMHIGDPRHAAQLVTEQGDVESFDDPGCAIRWIADHHPAIHRFWFHGEGDRWIPADEVRFVTAGETPMGSGLLAVEAGSPGARSLRDVQGTLP